MAKDVRGDQVRVVLHQEAPEPGDLARHARVIDQLTFAEQLARLEIGFADVALHVLGDANSVDLVPRRDADVADAPIILVFGSEDVSPPIDDLLGDRREDSTRGAAADHVWIVVENREHLLRKGVGQPLLRNRDLDRADFLAYAAIGAEFLHDVRIVEAFAVIVEFDRVGVADRAAAVAAAAIARITSLVVPDHLGFLHGLLHFEQYGPRGDLA